MEILVKNGNFGRKWKFLFDQNLKMQNFDCIHIFTILLKGVDVWMTLTIANIHILLECAEEAQIGNVVLKNPSKLEITIGTIIRDTH